MEAVTDIDVPDALEHKVGPLPLGVWLLAVAGGVGIAWWVRRNSSSSTADPATVPDSTVYTQPNGVGQQTDATTDDTGTAPTPTTNEEWGQQSITKMIARGYQPTMVDSAIRDYLGGATLTTVERALIAETLVVCGPPPVPPPPEVPGGTTPPPTVPITPKPPAHDAPSRTPPAVVKSPPVVLARRLGL